MSLRRLARHDGGKLQPTLNQLVHDDLLAERLTGWERGGEERVVVEQGRRGGGRARAGRAGVGLAGAPAVREEQTFARTEV